MVYLGFRADPPILTIFMILPELADGLVGAVVPVVSAMTQRRSCRSQGGVSMALRLAQTALLLLLAIPAFAADQAEVELPEIEIVSPDEGVSDEAIPEPEEVFADEAIEMEESVLPESVSKPLKKHGRCRHKQCAGSSVTTFDLLFLERTNDTNGQTLVLYGPLAPTPGGTILTTRGMVFETTPGMRLFHAKRDCDGDGWELGYWGVFGMDAVNRADFADGLAVPGDLGLAVPGWQTADAIKAGYTSAVNVGELNFFLADNWSTTTCNPKNPCHTVSRTTQVDWLGGLFWAGVDETAFLRITTDPSVPTTAYRTEASSNMVGFQTGVRARRQWELWALEGFLKVGLGGSWLSQSTSPITTGLAPDFEYRPGREAQTTNTGFLSSMNITAVRSIGEHWSLRVGYNLAWLSGLALAPNQFDFTDTDTSGTGINGAGTMFLFGANLGVERKW